jgi:hypothetical protein
VTSYEALDVAMTDPDRVGEPNTSHSEYLMRWRFTGVQPRCVVLAAALIVTTACSSSTEAIRQNVTADGFKISVSATPDTVVVGDYLTITMIAENTTSETIMRAFPPNNFGPEPSFDVSHFDPSFDVGGFFGNLMEAGARDTMTLAPHAQATASWSFRASKVGAVTIAGCFPENNDGLHPQVCDTQGVTIVAP